MEISSLMAPLVLDSWQIYLMTGVQEEHDVTEFTGIYYRVQSSVVLDRGTASWAPLIFGRVRWEQTGEGHGRREESRMDLRAHETGSRIVRIFLRRK
jgi:hypothetical protein